MMTRFLLAAVLLIANGKAFAADSASLRGNRAVVSVGRAVERAIIIGISNPIISLKLEGKLAPLSSPATPMPTVGAADPKVLAFLERANGAGMRGFILGESAPNGQAGTVHPIEALLQVRKALEPLSVSDIRRMPLGALERRIQHIADALGRLPKPESEMVEGGNRLEIGPNHPLPRARTASYLKQVDGRSIGVSRIESLFGKPVEVINVSDYVAETQSSSAPDLKLFSIGAIFSEKKAFLGFGQPNVYLAIPKGDSVYKFDAKSLKRADSRVVPTLGKAQSGLLIVFKNLDQAFLEKMLAKAKEHEGTRQMTCVNANCRVLSDLDFTVGGKSLNDYYFPMPLLQAIIEKGLELNGKPVEFDLVRTTPHYLENYRLKVDQAVAATPVRHMPGRVKDFFSKWLSRKPKSNPAPALPVRFPAQAQETGDFDIRVSQPSRFGGLLRLFWGSHMLFRVEQKKVSIDGYLPDSMKAFPQANPGWVTRLKRGILFSRPIVAFIRSQLAQSYRRFEGRSDRELFDMLPADSPEHPNKYNVVMENGGITVMKLDVGAKTVDWVLSKHVLISGYSPDVRYAGEMWKGEDGKIYLNNNSGTYMPSAEQLQRAAAYLRAVFPNVEFVESAAK